MGLGSPGAASPTKPAGQYYQHYSSNPRKRTLHMDSMGETSPTHTHYIVVSRTHLIRTSSSNENCTAIIWLFDIFFFPCFCKILEAWMRYRNDLLRRIFVRLCICITLFCWVNSKTPSDAQSGMKAHLSLMNLTFMSLVTSYKNNPCEILTYSPKLIPVHNLYEFSETWLLWVFFFLEGKSL